MYRYGPMRFHHLFFAIFLFSALSVCAQTASLRGQVKDESGAMIPGATVLATGASGSQLSTVSGADGAYLLKGVPDGRYQVEAKYSGFEMKSPVFFVAHGRDANLNLILKVSTVIQNVTVQAQDSVTVSVDSSNNASSVVLSGSKLDSLADNPDDLASDLQALAGPSAGPNGGSVYIDGFSTGEMPPKESIREIRINQNPFSPEYDSLGLGRIEIFTKPGSGQFHGSAFFNIGSDVFNSRNPYAAVKAPFLLREFGTSIAGPLTRRSSFTFNARGDDTNNGAIINGATVDPTSLAIVSPYTGVHDVAQHRYLFTPNVDYQLNDKVTLSMRYRVTQVDIPDAGLGGFNLVESADHAHMLAQTAQFVDTDVLNDKAVNETRFQFFNVSSSMAAVNSGASIQVLNAFTGGGSTVGDSSNVQRNFELQNLTTLTHGAAVWHFGARLRATIQQNTSRQNFNGAFTFGGGTAPELDANNQVIKDASGNPVLISLSSIQQYQRTLILDKAGLTTAQVQALGGGPSQFSLSAGNPLVSLSQIDAGLFVGNTWKLRPNLTVDLGLRYEVQNNISDRGDFAPRVAASWSPGVSRQKLVLRAGFGLFYDRFALSNTLNAQRYNGINQQQYVVNNPTFYPDVPSPASLAASLQGQVIEQNAPNVRAPYLMQSLFSVEQQLPMHTVAALSYSNSHGLHQLRSRDINAPATPGGPYPLGNNNPVFQVESSGLFNQNQFILNVTSQPSKNISLFGSYTYGKALSNTDGASTFPASPYSMAGEYGPAGTDVRNFETFGGTIQSIWKTTFSPLLTVRSGPPFNITVGRDLYGTTLFNGRPGVATDPTRIGVIQTRYGLLDPAPAAGEALLPRNFGRGPGAIQFNLRASKMIGFGVAKATGDSPARSRFGLICTLQMRNLLNHNNPGPIIGNIASPLFGKANQTAGSSTQTGTQMSESATNRRFELQMRFTF
ncbi:MAG TPA: TonB-dependent receptor [Terracidiphilus sp.]|nr:TonB-dependent receptor [Terracidiphilus sp.]